jgi:nitrogen regulatory protein P-II 1
VGGEKMKKIEAVIRPEKLNDVKEKLKSLGYPGMSITRIEGHGKQKGKVEQFRGREYRQEFLPKIKLEIVVKDQDLENIIKAIVEAGKTDKIGDGKIFISEVIDIVKIRTGERGEKAL